MSKDDDEEDGVAIDAVIAAIAARGRTRGDHVVTTTAPQSSVPTKKPFIIGVAVLILAVTVTVSVAVAVSAAVTLPAAVISSAVPFS